jgi:hypothetical protein
MFRAYARFGVVVQLMAALLAGVGVDRLRRAGTARVAGKGASPQQDNRFSSNAS